jgi:hypothetical protein
MSKAKFYPKFYPVDVKVYYQLADKVDITIRKNDGELGFCDLSCSLTKEETRILFNLSRDIFLRASGYNVVNGT